MSETSPSPQTIERDYQAYTAGVSVRNSRVASLLVVFLMPAGILLEWLNYPERVFEFGVLRLISSVLALAVWFRLRSAHLSAAETKLLCMGWWVIPAFFISLMIAFTEGANSPYYAGLSLVILAVSTVIQATLRESLRAFLCIVGLYLAACFINPWLTASPVGWQMLGNNMYFISVTSIIVLAGNYYYNRLRFSEFSAQAKLKASEAQLQTSNQELAATNEELHRTQAQLVQQEKAELLSQVSTGILHDVRNLLAPVPNYLFKLKRLGEALPSDQRASYLDSLVKIERPMNAARAVFTTIERYAHGGPQMSHHCVLRDIVADAVNLVRARCEDGKITVTVRVEPDFVVLGQPLDLTLVLKNLLDNSIDALADKPSDGEGHTIWIESRLEPGRGFLSLRDNGAGIKAEHLARIFESFFTTKSAGKGTGLGLANCKRTIEALGGAISVRSEPGQGAEFVLQFPRHSSILDTTPGTP